MLRDLFKHMSEFDLSFFSNSTASQFLRHFLLKGTLQDIEVLQKRLRRLLGDLTFLEAFNLSGRMISQPKQCSWLVHVLGKARQLSTY